jgi:hypothetical protein
MTYLNALDFCISKFLFFKYLILIVNYSYAEGFRDQGKKMWTPSFFSLDCAPALGMKRTFESRQRGGSPVRAAYNNKKALLMGRFDHFVGGSTAKNNNKIRPPDAGFFLPARQAKKSDRQGRQEEENFWPGTSGGAGKFALKFC